ncbi:hypothetical protein SDC9_30193 [bioreactor metagenome]|uniref:Uncharacterized protein n=1 Tax=bioreactor metagenome TaxID=1076179 RepID=A0A644UYR8_9ZZZZ|nr:hypothetical protein [Paludibacter sp.]
MPYRRLPNTDQSRLRALRTAIQKEDKSGYNNHVIAFKTILEAKNFLSFFEKQQLQYQQTLENQVNANKRYQQIIHNVRLYISHFIQVFNLAVIRGDIKKEHKLFYQLDPEVHNVPDLSTESALLHWGKCIIDGENERIRNGGLPIYNPAIAKVKVHYEIFKEYKSTQKIHQNSTTRQWEELVSLRTKGDEIILDIWNQVEAYFKDMDPFDKLEKCREYGLVYYYRKGEPELTRSSPME